MPNIPTDTGPPVSKPEQREESDMKRSKMSNKHSRKLFTRTADKVHGKNMQGAPMRGGIRL